MTVVLLLDDPAVRERSSTPRTERVWERDWSRAASWGGRGVEVERGAAIGAELSIELVEGDGGKVVGSEVDWKGTRRGRKEGDVVSFQGFWGRFFRAGKGGAYHLFKTNSFWVEMKGK